MAKRPSERKLILARKAARDGYATFRYGSASPVSLPRVFTGEKRRSMVAKAMDVLRDWRESPFEHEGAARAGIRAGLCMDGHGWQVADNEAAALIEEGLHLMGAKRPSWAAGQPEYTIGRENCANCRGPLDDEALARRDRFCCDECRRMMRTYRNDRYHYAAAEATKWAYAVACKEGIPERSCEWCATMFKPATPDTVACSPAHAAKLREQRAGRAIPDRECKNPSCGKRFQPAKRTVEYCCSACHREHQADLIGPSLCENPACGKVFHPRFAFEKYCEAKCRRAVERARTLPPKPCLRCGREFEPRKPSVAYCSRSCASKARAEKASAFICEEIKEAA